MTRKNKRITYYTRAERAGQLLGHSIVEMVNLMYQNKTAINFYRGLNRVISREVSRRKTSSESDEK